MNQHSKIRILAESAILVAVALVLDILAGLYSPFPWGGSISPAMLPIFVLAVRHGVKPGILAGLIFGGLQLVLAGSNAVPIAATFGIKMAGYALDYLVAFAVLGVAGLFPKALFDGKSFVAGILLGSFLRYLAHGFSGVLVWKDYAPEGMGIWYYSFIAYNLPYMAASAALCLIIGLILQRRGILAMGKKSPSGE